MVIQCPECGKKYKIDPEKVPEKGAKITCPECSHAFVVKRKDKESTEKEPAIKTPPCVICGNPSSRVLQGEPVMLLCEACFEREKEKRRRFEVTPGQDIPPSPGPKTEMEKPTEEEEFKPEPEAAGAADYFDSFDEVPDMGDIPPEPASPPAAAKTFIDQPPSQPESEKPAFEESEFEEPPRPMTPPQKPREMDTPMSRPQRVSGDEADTDYTFSPREVSHLEETIKPETSAAAPPSPAALDGFTTAGKTEDELDKEIFGEVAAEAKKAKPLTPAIQKAGKLFLLKIPAKAAIGVAATVLVLAAGYFLATNSNLRATISRIGAGTPRTTRGQEPAQISDEQRKVFTEHLNYAGELYRLDTKKSYVESLKEIGAALKIDPKSPKARVLQFLVSSLLAFRDQNWLLRARAKALLKKTSPEMMRDPDAQVARALVYLIEKDYSAAQVVAQKLVEQQPDNALASWVLAHIYLASTIKNFDKAEPLLKKAVELDPKLVLAHYELGELYLARKDYAQASGQFQELLKISPDRTEAGLRIKEIDAALKPGLTPPALAQRPPEQGEALPIAPGTTAHIAGAALAPKPAQGGTAPAAEIPAPDLNQEIQNHVFGIMNETRKPMSRVRQSSQPPPPAAPQPATGATAPAAPPEESTTPAAPPARPPEEAP